jgi:hypothetical protein
MELFKERCREVTKLFEKFTKSVGLCLDYSSRSVIEYANKGESEIVNDLARRTHEAESRADKYRRDIIDRLIKGAFLPETRRDLMNLVENIDNVADEAEEVLDNLLFVGADISMLDKEGIRSMFDLLEKQFAVLKESVQFLFKDIFQAAGKTITLQRIEAEIDKKEEAIMRKVKAEEQDLATKMFCQKTVKAIADIGDVIENAGDDIAVIVAVKDVFGGE